VLIRASITPLRVVIRTMPTQPAVGVLRSNHRMGDIKITLLRASKRHGSCSSWRLRSRASTVDSGSPSALCLILTTRRQTLSNMPGGFYYPVVPLYVNINDQVEVSWWSTFANRLQFWCYEGRNAGPGYSTTPTRHPQRSRPC
jgi:hypothetical protein